MTINQTNRDPIIIKLPDGTPLTLTYRQQDSVFVNDNLPGF